MGLSGRAIHQLYKNICKHCRLTAVVVSFLGLQGCGIYNFSGANLPPDIKTVSVENFINETGLGPPRLQQNFSQKLRDYLQANSTLRGVAKDGDLHFEGSITRYYIEPVAPTGNEISRFSRLKVHFKVKFTNTKYEKLSFEQEFVNYEDFLSSQPLTAVENELLELIMDRTIFDVFNKALLSNW